MNLSEWAIRWQIPHAALADLERMFGAIDTEPANYQGGESEAAVQNRIRLEMSRVGGRIWRNNVGATYTDEGSFIRYGLANDSQQMNKLTKSSDLIGLKPVKIERYHVGLTLGVFVAREVKPENWHYTGTDREVAQLAFLRLVAGLGGDAAFATGEGTL